MDKNSIKKYAIFARNALIERVRTRAQRYGITEDGPNALNAVTRADGELMSEAEKAQRGALICRIKAVGFEQAMEEAAYTWFNRFCALRFMEVNGYLPSKIRVFSDENNTFKPQILAEAIELGDKFENIDMDKVYAMKEANETEALYKYLLITQCNELKPLLPSLFTKIEDYTELLFPEHLLHEGSVIDKLISDIPEDDFNVESENGQIEIIGWLYQYYISEKHEEIVDPLHGKFINKDDIPAATQLFTPDWVVRYLVDNTVGRYWSEHHSASQLPSALKYYVSPSCPREIKEDIKPQELTIFDPCVGSGHFLVYAFDVLMQIYREYGYSDKDAASEIIQHNLYGLDIDSRATQLAYFAIMMKGCQYDRRFLRRGVQPQIYDIQDSIFVDNAFINYICSSHEDLREDVCAIIDVMKNAQETGSLTPIPAFRREQLIERITELQTKKDLFNTDKVNIFKNILDVVNILATDYAVVITNPPYMNKYDAELKQFIHDYYKDYSGDLFSVFIYRCLQLCKPNGYAGLMTPNVWMFIKSYEKLRRYIIENHSITTLVQMAKGAFFSEATVDVCAFVIQAQQQNEDGVYFRLEEFTGNMDVQEEKLLEALHAPECTYKYQASSSLFSKLPGMPLGYWSGDAIIQAFQNGHALEKKASPRQGLATTDNNLYLRHWYEVEFDHIGFGLDRQTATTSDLKWFPYNKGGEFRKWYGNQDYVVNYQHDGAAIKNDVLTKYPYLKTPDFVVKNPDTYFKPCLSWSKISSGSVAFRYFPQGFLYDVSGCSIFFERIEDLYYYAGFLNSTVCSNILEIISPTLNYETGHIAILPILESETHADRVRELVLQNISIAQEDWNQFETSWDFRLHPFVRLRQTFNGNAKIEDIFEVWKKECSKRFECMKSNEEELNSIFINIYGLNNKLYSEIEDKKITIRKADLQRDVKSFLSYAVGCIFGRYSLDCDENTESRKPNSENYYCTDNIIPITDDDYFADDIINRFISFVSLVFGEETLEENLRFMAEALDNSDNSKEVLRSYFLNDFYSEHVKTYQKRPIYWQFDSGKKNGFKCLIYMHRYQPDTIARIRTDYIHELQSRLKTAISDIENQIQTKTGARAVKLKKQLKKLNDQNDEIFIFEEKIHHLSDQMLHIDLDDGVKVNYAKFGDVLAGVK